MADDDTFVHLPSAGRALGVLPDDGTPTYWGAFQCYHWSRQLFIPTHFCYDFIERRIGGCRAVARRPRQPSDRPTVTYAATAAGERDVLVGPFFFAQGTAHFVSRELALALVRNTSLIDEAVSRIPDGDSGAPGECGGHCLPYEDVWLGHAIAQLSGLSRARLRLVERQKSTAFRHFPYCHADGCARDFARAAANAQQRAHCDMATVNISSDCVQYQHPTCGGAAMSVCGRNNPSGECPGDAEWRECQDAKSTEWCGPRKSHCDAPDTRIRDYIRARCNATCGGCGPKRQVGRTPVAEQTQS
jgi:hypothetical protein